MRLVKEYISSEEETEVTKCNNLEIR